MPIKVVYDQLKLSEKSNAQELKRLMCRDASWGTHVEELQAVAGSLGSTTIARCRKLEPKLTNDVAGLAIDERFTMEFPENDFDLHSEGIDHFVGTIAGDILRSSGIESIRVKDFELTVPSLFSAFPGPNVGIDGLYGSLLKKSLNGIQRPIIAFTVKPRIGLNVEEYVQIYREAASAGIDIIEDDERLVNPNYCKFEDRVAELSKAQKKFGGVYSANISADSATALERLEYCAKQGIQMVKCDVLVTGFETLRKLALAIRDKYKASMAITVYPDAFGAYRNLSRDFILRLSRLCGADIIYAGSPNWARYGGEPGKLKEAIDPVFQWHELLSSPLGPQGNIRPSLPTVTNDQHPSRAEALVAYFRKHKSGHFRYAFFVGGGVSGFPAPSLGEAARVCVDCVQHAATSSLTNYKNFDFGKYHNDMDKIGWTPLDVAGAIK